MVMSDPPTECAWAREAVSARLDGELAELESLRLDPHLRACAGLLRPSLGHRRPRRVAIRDAALEQPAARMFTPAAPRRLGGGSARSRSAAALALAAAAVLALVFAGRALGAQSARRSQPATPQAPGRIVDPAARARPGCGDARRRPAPGGGGSIHSGSRPLALFRCLTKLRPPSSYERGTERPLRGVGASRRRRGNELPAHIKTEGIDAQTAMARSREWRLRCSPWQPARARRPSVAERDASSPPRRSRRHGRTFRGRRRPARRRACSCSGWSRTSPASTPVRRRRTRTGRR